MEVHLYRTCLAWHVLLPEVVDDSTTDKSYTKSIALEVLDQPV